MFPSHNLVENLKSHRSLAPRSSHTIYSHISGSAQQSHSPFCQDPDILLSSAGGQIQIQSVSAKYGTLHIMIMDHGNIKSSPVNKYLDEKHFFVLYPGLCPGLVTQSPMVRQHNNTIHGAYQQQYYSTVELQMKVPEDYTMVSIVSHFCRLFLMTFALASQFHVYLLWVNVH